MLNKDILLSRLSLLSSLVKRDLSTKYKGTAFGFAWSIITPLFMLLVYSTVFLVVFKAKWNLPNSEEADYALMLFVGLLCHICIAEVLASSSSIIINNVNLVKKVVFPVFLLPINTVCTALINFCIGLALCFVYAFIRGYITNWTGFLYLPYVVFVYFITLISISYLFSIIGVLFRDINQVIPVLNTILLFTSTVFFSIESAPKELVPLLYLNPISIIADTLRDIIYGISLNVFFLSKQLFVSTLILIVTWILFKKLSRSFADII